MTDEINRTLSDAEVMQELLDAPLGRLNNLILWCFSRNIKFLRILMKLFLHIELPSPAPKMLRLGHPFFVVVHSKAIVGENVTLYQGVTIGEARIGSRRGVPKIGNNVIIYPNTVIIGNVSIGNNVIIGAGSVVTTDIPNGAMAFGNPARVVRII